jgi:hypothetical protein
MSKFEKPAYPVIVVEADAVSVRNSNQEKIKQDFYSGQFKEKSSGYEAMIDPTEGALDFADP